MLLFLQGFNDIYYIDKSVLVENRPLVKFIRNYIRDSSGVFSISSLVRISMTSFPALTLLFVQKYSYLYNKKKITWWLEDMNSIFSWYKTILYHSKIKFISSRRRVISSIHLVWNHHAYVECIGTCMWHHLLYMASRFSVSFDCFWGVNIYYVLTSQKRASDWLKISRRFCWAPSIQNRNSRFLVKKRPETK